MFNYPCSVFSYGKVNTHHTSHITHHTSHITHHTSHTTHHTSHITHHTSHITHHTSHIAKHCKLNTHASHRALHIIICAWRTLKGRRFCIKHHTSHNHTITQSHFIQYTAYHIVNTRMTYITQHASHKTSHMTYKTQELFIADKDNCAVRKISEDHTVST